MRPISQPALAEDAEFVGESLLRRRGLAALRRPLARSPRPDDHPVRHWPESACPPRREALWRPRRLILYEPAKTCVVWRRLVDSCYCLQPNDMKLMWWCCLAVDALDNG